MFRALLIVIALLGAIAAGASALSLSNSGPANQVRIELRAATTNTTTLHAYSYKQDGQTAVVCALNKRDARAVLGASATVGKRLGHAADVRYCGAPQFATPRKAADFVLKCETTPFTVGCETSKWDDAIKLVLSATRHDGAVVKWCPSNVRYGAWRNGFCRGIQDDSSPAHIVWSNEGIYARASLVK